MSRDEYLLADQPSELERLQLQSRVWEPSGRELLSRIGDGSGRRALDVGCGALGWLRILGQWVGPSGQVLGTDIDGNLLDAARSFLDAEGIGNVELVVDDLFDSQLEPQSFDLVHARYVIAPLGRGAEQVASYGRLVRPGGSLILEEWDLGSWHFNPPAPAAERLIRLLTEIFAGLGGEAGRELPALLREIGCEKPEIDARVIALRPGHPVPASAASVQRCARAAAPRDVERRRASLAARRGRERTRRAGQMGYDVHPDSELGKARKLSDRGATGRPRGAQRASASRTASVISSVPTSTT